jgi:hypothetical protein
MPASSLLVFSPPATAMIFSAVRIKSFAAASVF